MSPEASTRYRLFRDPERTPDGDLVTGPLEFDRTLKELWDDRNTRPRGPRGERTIRFGIDDLERAARGRFGAQFNAGRARREREVRRPLRDENPVAAPFGDTTDFLRILQEDPPQRLLNIETQGRLLAINVNYAPLLRHHFLLVPEPESRLPQRLDERAFLDGFRLFEISRADNLFMGFNSRGSWASINHLHFHCVYYEGIHSSSSGNTLPVFREPTEPLFELPDLRVERLNGYPIRAVVLQGEDPRRLAIAASSFVAGLQAENQPHVTLLTRDRVIVFPKTRDRGTLSPTGVGFFEAGGEMFFGERTTFERADEGVIERELAISSLSTAAFDRLVSHWRSRLRG